MQLLLPISVQAACVPAIENLESITQSRDTKTIREGQTETEEGARESQWEEGGYAEV